MMALAFGGVGGGAFGVASSVRKRLIRVTDLSRGRSAMAGGNWLALLAAGVAGRLAAANMLVAVLG